MDTIKKIKKASNVYQIINELTEDELAKVIEVSSDAYYNDLPIIDDQTYDILVEKLKSINPKNKILTRIGAPVKGKKVKLPFWLGSMDKIKTEEKQLDKFTISYKGPYCISDKLDGISCMMTLSDGKINLYTRGDGTYGQDITHLVDHVNIGADTLLKNKFQRGEVVAIRGEMIIKKDVFNKKYAKSFANARNLAGGTVNSKLEKLNLSQAKDVDFVTYEIIQPSKLKPSDQLKTLKKWGLNVAYYDIYEDISLEILDEVLQSRKKKSPYEIDGIIITDDHPHTRNKSGNPDYSFAYKGSTPSADVKVISIKWSPSKDGMIIPRVHFETVKLSGAELSYTTGFNAKYIVDNKIGPGAIIKIVRSGDVIPYILEVVKPAKKASLPDLEYEWDENNVNIILTNKDKNSTVITKRITKFLRDIGVENMSEGIVTKLVDNGYKTIPKVISLKKSDLLELDGFGETLANKLVNNLEKQLKKLDILTLMVASNCFGRGFGTKKIKKILEAYPSIIDEYSSKTHQKWYDKLVELEGFDDTSVEAFLKPMGDFQKFLSIIKKIVPVRGFVTKKKTGGSFTDQKVVFTGFRCKPWEEIIEAEGGKVSGSVSKNTTLLVYNDGEESSSKYLTAKKLGVKTMTKSAFAKKYDLE